MFLRHPFRSILSGTMMMCNTSSIFQCFFHNNCYNLHIIFLYIIYPLVRLENKTTVNICSIQIAMRRLSVFRHEGENRCIVRLKAMRRMCPYKSNIFDFFIDSRNNSFIYFSDYIPISRNFCSIRNDSF